LALWYPYLITTMYIRYLFFFMFVHGTLGANAVSLQDSISYGIISINNQAFIERPIELSCFWEFYPDELLTSKQMDRSEKLHFMKMPHWWKEENGKPIIEFASYRLKVITHCDEKTDWAIAMPTAYCSYELWIDGVPIGNNGIVAKSQKFSRPQWKPDTYSFKCASDTMEILIRASSFYHYRKGISDPIFLGTAQQLFKSKNDIEIADLVLLVTLVLLFLIGLYHYYLKMEKPYLFYSLLCISWMLRAAFSNHYPAVQWFPQINWFFVVRAEYTGIYLATLFGALLLGSLYPRDVNKPFIQVISMLCSTNKCNF
jgi:hypothetical protein